MKFTQSSKSNSNYHLNKFIFIFALLCLQFQLLLAQPDSRRTIAILNFDNNSVMSQQEMEPLSQGLADMLTTEMSQIESFQVVERAKLQELLSEISLGQSGVLDASTAQQVGKLVGAKNLLLGGFVNMFGGKMRIDVRIVEVETGLTLRAVEETDKVDKLFEMVREISEKISKYFEIKITKEDKKRLDKIEGTENFDAALLYAKGVESEDMARNLLNQGKKSGAKEKFQESLDFFRQAARIDKNFTNANDGIVRIRKTLNSLTINDNKHRIKKYKSYRASLR